MLSQTAISLLYPYKSQGRDGSTPSLMSPLGLRYIVMPIKHVGAWHEWNMTLVKFNKTTHFWKDIFIWKWCDKSHQMNSLARVKYEWHFYSKCKVMFSLHTVLQANLLQTNWGDLHWNEQLVVNSVYFFYFFIYSWLHVIWITYPD